LVTTDLDQGPILAQAVLPVRDSDSELSLAQRVLNLEHQILPRAVRWMAQGRVQVMAGVAQIVGVEASERLLIEGWDDAKA
jgi:phosphoribosylglycinamide formyltransferase-1